MTTVPAWRAHTGMSACGPCNGCRGGTTPSAEYKVLGADDRVRVTGTTAVPYRYIVNIEFDGWAGCSGLLIGPSTVLTAGHCVMDASGRPVPVRGLTVIPARNRGVRPFGTSGVVRTFARPGYAPSTRTDLGIIHLARPLGRAAGWWTRTARPTARDPLGTSMSSTLAPQAGRLFVNAAGYPQDMPAGAATACRGPSGRPCDTAANPARSKAVCGTEMWRDTDRLVSLANGLLHHAADTCNAQSGSPVWVRRTAALGGRVLVGVHVGGDTAVGTNWAVHLDAPSLAWIARLTR